jgi:hypothetical protein
VFWCDVAVDDDVDGADVAGDGHLLNINLVNRTLNRGEDA